MRSIYIAAIALAVLIAGVLGYLALRPAPEAKAPQAQKEEQRASGSMITLTTKKGARVSVPDFTFNKPRIEVEESGITYVHVTQTPDGIEEDPTHGMLFGSDSSITIALFAEPLGPVRQAAEASLRRHLPLPDAILCDLTVMVEVPDTIAPRYAGQNLGLSFCPGAVTLP